jgi:hypothetical protein
LKKNIVSITRLLIFAVCALFITGIIAGCSNDTGNNSDEQKTATLMGNVKDASTGAFLTGVSLSVAGVGGLSDAKGNYMLSNIEPGKHILTATMNGYQDYSDEVNLLAGVNDLNIIMVPLEQ